MAGAQQLGREPSPTGPISANCACSAAPSPGDENEPEEGRDRKKRWAILGAAGLGLVFGLPFGGGTAQGLPFAGAIPTEDAVGDLAASPADPSPVIGSVPAEVPTLAGPAGRATPAQLAVVPTAPAVRPRGLIPPMTATHLPLIAALGIAMTGGGAWLVRKRGKQRRRRRRKVLL